MHETPCDKFGNFLKISIFFFFDFAHFWPSYAPKRVWSISGVLKPLCTMVYGWCGKSIGFFSGKVGKFSSPFSESPNIIEKPPGFFGGARALQTRFLAGNVGADFWPAGFWAEMGEKSRFWVFLLDFQRFIAPRLENGFA